MTHFKTFVGLWIGKLGFADYDRYYDFSSRRTSFDLANKALPTIKTLLRLSSCADFGLANKALPTVVNALLRSC